MFKILLLGFAFAANAHAAAPKKVEYYQSEKAGYVFTTPILCQTLPNGDDLILTVLLGMSPEDYAAATKRGEGSKLGLAVDYYRIYEASGVTFADIVPPEMLKAQFAEEEGFELTEDADVFDKVDFLFRPKLERFARQFAKDKGFSTYSLAVLPTYEKKPQKPCGK